MSKTQRRRKASRGGFYPSVMYGVAAAGPAFVGSCVFQGYRLVSNDKKRMASRKAGTGAGTAAGKRRRAHTKRRRTRT